MISATETQASAPLSYRVDQDESRWIEERLDQVAQRVFAQDLRFFPDELSDGDLLAVVREMDSGAWLRPYAAYKVKRQMDLLKGSVQNSDVGDKMWTEAFGDQDQEARLRALAQLNAAMQSRRVRSTYSYALAMHPRLLLTHWCQHPEQHGEILAALSSLKDPYLAPKVFLAGDQEQRYLSRLPAAVLTRWLASAPEQLRNFPAQKTAVLASCLESQDAAKLERLMSELGFDPDVQWVQLYEDCLKYWPAAPQRQDLLERAANDRQGFVHLVLRHLDRYGKPERLPSGELKILRELDPSPAEWGSAPEHKQRLLMEGDLPAKVEDPTATTTNNSSTCCESCTIL